MKAVGIVAEYNPFHTGHGYQIARTRAQLGEDRPVVAVMSGNWVQQARPAVADKWVRTRLALMGGADLVVELPTVWAAAPAESFAWGAVGILHACGVVDTLCFGSECGRVEELAQVARCLDSEPYRQALASRLKGPDTFAVCRQRAVGELLGRRAAQSLSGPNNNLGVEYIRALARLGSSMVPMTVQRLGAGHDTLDGEGAEHLSATQIRRALARDDWHSVEGYLPADARELLEGRMCSGPERVERAVLARLRTMSEADWAKLPEAGLGEGLPRRLERAGTSCTDLEDFFARAKTKRYTRARLNRLVLWAYLGLRAEDVPDRPAYIRVLGFNERGRGLLREMKKQASLPVLTKPAHARRLSGAGRALFELEGRCTDLYDLCFDPVPAPGREWSTDPVILL